MYIFSIIANCIFVLGGVDVNVYNNRKRKLIYELIQLEQTEPQVNQHYSTI